MGQGTKIPPNSPANGPGESKEAGGNEEKAKPLTEEEFDALDELEKDKYEWDPNAFGEGKGGYVLKKDQDAPV